MDFKSLSYEEDLQEDLQKHQYLIFKLDSGTYGIDIKNVTEIVNIQTITAVPGMPTYIKGIINLRGKIIPVVDVRLRFELPTVAYNDRTCIIIIEWKGFTVGLVVDGVSEVLTMNDENILDPPEFNDKENKYIEFIGKTENALICIINCETLLTYEDKLLF